MHFKKNKILLIITFLCFQITFSQKLQIHTLEQVESLQLKEKRPVLVFVSSSWCIHCKKMKQTVFKDTEIIKLLNTKYYLIFIEADAKNPLYFQNKKYEFKPNGITVGYNEIVNVLFENEQITFPSFLIYNSEWKRLLILKTAFNKKTFLELFDTSKT